MPPYLTVGINLLHDHISSNWFALTKRLFWLLSDCYTFTKCTKKNVKTASCGILPRSAFVQLLLRWWLTVDSCNILFILQEIKPLKKTTTNFCLVKAIEKTSGVNNFNTTLEEIILLRRQNHFLLYILLKILNYCVQCSLHAIFYGHFFHHKT